MKFMHLLLGSILLSLISSAYANHPRGKAQAGCVSAVYKIEWELLGHDIDQIDVSKLNPRQLKKFIKLNKEVLGRTNVICREGPFGECFTHAFKEYQAIYPNKRKSEAWYKATALCKQNQVDYGCMKIYAPYIERTYPSAGRRIILEQSANRCMYFKFGGCVSFVLDKELNQLKNSERVAYNNAQKICHGVVFPDCIAKSYELYMKGQKQLTQALWDKIGWMCRR